MIRVRSSLALAVLAVGTATHLDSAEVWEALLLDMPMVR
jgi:hypothetical protein